MSIIGSILKRGLKLRKKATFKRGTPQSQLVAVLKKLLTQAENTAFGQNYHFGQLLASSSDANAFFEHYKKSVPVFDYNKIHNAWWHRTLEAYLTKKIIEITEMI